MLKVLKPPVQYLGELRFPELARGFLRGPVFLLFLESQPQADKANY